MLLRIIIQLFNNISGKTMDQNCNQRSSAQYVELKKMSSINFMFTWDVLKALTKCISKELQDRQTTQVLYRLIYYSKSALHVSGNVFAHHQEHLTVFTVSGSVHPSVHASQST
jgi:hypothetical protein